jgi:hypothetical protein
LHLAQEIVAKKCGIIKERDPLDNLTQQQYLNLYKQPLTNQSMEAILKLSKVAVDKVKKKKLKKQKKTKEGTKVKETKKSQKKVAKEKGGQEDEEGSYGCHSLIWLPLV